MTITRRSLQLGLGLLWLLDAALQFQPFMFTKAFARSALAPAGAGQPPVVSHPVHFAAQLVVAHPVLTNTAFAVIQLALAVGLLWRRSARIALLVSIVWAMSVWWLGEGLGGLTTGETLLTGAPGAALLYAVIAVLALPDRDGDSSTQPSWLAIPAWAALWVSGAGLQLAAGNNSGGAFGAMFADAGTESPGWIATLDHHFAAVHFSTGVVAALIATEILVAMWAVVPGATRRLSVAAGTAIALASWLVVQGLGDLTSGQATDPNTGPLIVLLATAVLGAAPARSEWRWTPQSKVGRTSRLRLSS